MEGLNARLWNNGIDIDAETMEQIRKMSRLPILAGPLAIMPDAHLGKGSTVGSVIFTRKAVIPACVGVDVGCGMTAVPLGIDADRLPSNLGGLRQEIESGVPVGSNGHVSIPSLREVPILDIERKQLIKRFKTVSLKAKIQKNMPDVWGQCGSLGGGNHFIELSIDEDGHVWLMLHSGSRGIGNKLASIAMETAKEHMMQNHVFLEDRDLAWLDEGTREFDEYIEALQWSQDYAALNRNIMVHEVLKSLKRCGLEVQMPTDPIVSCHHNYTEKETHFGVQGWLTRKGAVKAGKGDLGIIPGSMGTKSYIVRGKGNPLSYESCSHGAGRNFSRSEAKRRFTEEDVLEQTKGVECRKDTGIIDELPLAYKDIDQVIAAQSDLIEVVHVLKQVLCVKG